MQLIVKLFATWGGSGYAPYASGTFGTLAAIPFYIWLSHLPLPVYLLTLLAFIFAASWISGQAELLFNENDSGKIVIDEVAGYLVTMTGVTADWRWIVAGFFLFRFFDIVKPPPASWFDQKMKNGYGVVLDDVVAGIYASICLQIILRLAI